MLRRAARLCLPFPILLPAIPGPFLARHVRAVRAAEQMPVGLDPVPDHAAAAVLAERRERVDRTLEAVEEMSGAVEDLERLVVVVPTDLATRHEFTGHRRRRRT